MPAKRVLVTTPDYPPTRIGGISTFVMNLEAILKKLHIDYDLLVWESISDLRDKKVESFDFVLNAHYMASRVIKHDKTINFIHGGELLPYSPHFAKRMIKRFAHKKLMSYIEDSYLNVFISEYTFDLFSRYASKVDYARDIIHHNCIDINEARLIEKSWEDELVLCCFARDVPHKNLNGVIKLFKFFNEYHPKGARLYLTSDKGSSHPKITNLSNPTNEQREEIYKNSHLNLLLSLDHSDKGQIEGFGLTVLEAGKYGTPSIGRATGGLSESIHHKKTGWCLQEETREDYIKLYDYFHSHYSELTKEVFNHTVADHGLDKYEKLIRSIL